MRARIAAAAAAAALVLVAPASAGFHRDARLGNNTEGATAITRGPNAGQVGLIDGYDVLAIPVDGLARAEPHKLLDVKSVGWSALASGIAYIPTERHPQAGRRSQLRDRRRRVAGRQRFLGHDDRDVDAPRYRPRSEHDRRVGLADAPLTAGPVPPRRFRRRAHGVPGGTVSMCPFDGTGVETYTRTGTLVGSLDFAAVAGVPVRRCSALTYLGSIDAYAVSLPGSANRQKVFLVSRGGTLLGIITAPALVGALSSPPDDPNSLRVEVAGDVLARYKATTQALVSTQVLGTGALVDPQGFIAGRAGSYALLDGNDSEFAVFSP